MKSTWPCSAKISMTRATISLPHTGIIGLGMYSVKGEARVPRPPAKITTFTGVQLCSNTKRLAYITQDWNQNDIHDPGVPERANPEFPSFSSDSPAKTRALLPRRY